MLNLLTAHEISKRLNVSVASLRRWRLLQRGPQLVKVGALVRYRPEDPDSWLAVQPTGGCRREVGDRQLAQGADARVFRPPAMILFLWRPFIIRKILAISWA
jgi:hypothetical protein